MWERRLGWGWGTPTTNPLGSASACRGTGSQARAHAALASLWALPMPTLPLPPGLSIWLRLHNPPLERAAPSPKDLVAGRTGSI